MLPIITLTPSTSTRSSPQQYRRMNDFYIASYIQLSCNSSFTTTIQWTIHNCSSAQCSSPIEVHPMIATTYGELYIPARTLPFGVFQLKLTVTMAASANLSSSSSTYVEIVPSGIVVNLVPYGMSMITHGQQQSLELNPGTFSVDLDGDVFNASVSII